MSGDVDYGRELYPFLYDDGGSAPHPTGEDGDLAHAPHVDTLAVLFDEVMRSTREKAQTVVELRERMRLAHRTDLARCAEAMAQRFVAGGTLLAFGNGGSATDASDVVADCLTPPFGAWRALPALDLTSDGAILTAVANDVGFDNVFVRQVIAYGKPGDIAMGFSTSGSSRNVLAALRRAHAQGLLTVAFTGYDGGVVAGADYVDYCVVAPSDHIPRIQEGHATAWHALLAATQEALG